MTVFDVQRFSVHDGPGIRTTAFLKGCPLRCLWCQNPEGLEFGPGDPAGSGKVRQLSPEALAEELLADQVFFETSGGGVTFSGGEPLAQADELIACARILRAQGVSVAVESGLAVPAAVVDRVLPEIDLLLADLKVADPEDHRRWTGATNTGILENFRRAADHALAHAEFQLQARTPLVPGHTDTESNLRGLATFLAPWPGRWTWEWLDFNPLARAKYEALGILNYPFSQIRSGLAPDRRRHLEETLRCPTPSHPS